MTRGRIEIPKIRRVTIDAGEVAVLVERHQLFAQILS